MMKDRDRHHHSVVVVMAMKDVTRINLFLMDDLTYRVINLSCDVSRQTECQSWLNPLIQHMDPSRLRGDTGTPD